MILPYPAKAQAEAPNQTIDNRIALKVNEADLNSLTEVRVNILRQTGIDLLEITFPEPVNHSVLNDFHLLLNAGERFKTIYQMQSNPESVLSSVHSVYNEVPGQLRDNIEAVKFLDFPADYDERFSGTVGELVSQLSDSIRKPFYYQSAFFDPASTPTGFDFLSGRITPRMEFSPAGQLPVLLFEPADDLKISLQLLEALLNQSLSHSESIIIIPAEWFFSRIESSEAFATIITSYLKGEEVIFPMPADGPASPKINWPVIFLLILWASFIIHYKHQPMYRSAIPRYFFNHSFFVYDIIENRIRNTTSGIIVLIQHALLTGFFFYLLANAFISEMGLESLSSQFPVIIYPGFEELSLFLLGLTIAFFSHVISIVWLYVANKHIKQINQVINLYSWPLHINLVIVTLVVYFVQLSSAQNWLIVATIAYFFVWFFSFTIAAADSARFLNTFRFLNLFLTAGIHLLLISISIILVFLLPSIFEPIEMAFRLP